MFADAVDWPMGTYTLVKPKTGCPPRWMEGWRRQDSEDKDNKNWIAYDHHFYGSHDDNIRSSYSDGFVKNDITVLDLLVVMFHSLVQKSYNA
uniref:Apextrin C-terminal domain-containing protein n=1 Tax=Magallana gigas TaxID=29159 RepID=K1Q4H5_MAGGI